MFIRIRLIVLRSCVISFIIILLLQIVLWFKDDIDQWHTNGRLLRAEKFFWEAIADEDKTLSDEQRIQRIESIQKSGTDTEANWANILYESYRQKSVRLHERDATTPYKHRFEDARRNVSQRVFEVFEETLVFSRPKFCSSADVFHPQCPYSNCRWSCEEPSNNTEGLRRASVFHHADINEAAIHQKLLRRSPKDIWILWIDEANCSITHLNQYRFNWTLSFRRDSEVSVGTYGILIPQHRNRVPANDNLIDNPRFLQLYINRKIHPSDTIIENRILLNYRYRHKHALWFVSNCSPKRRLQYYTELKKFYPVKAFGSCVENKCNRSNRCEYEHAHLALFYLAFESQTCQDYITEKFWRALHYGMIPIVLGPSKQSYLDLGIPSTAFIHTDDFPSAEELADHLRAISTDYFRYRKYFRWLSRYDVFYDSNILEPIRMCELCMRLNMQAYREHSFYTDVHQWHRNSC